MIDFKDFDNVVKDNEKSIEVDFNIKELPIYTDFKLFKTKVQDVHIHLEIGKDEKNREYDILQRLEITFADNCFELNFNLDRSAYIVINTINSLKIGDEIKWGLTNTLFPKIAFVSNKDDFDDERSYKVYKRMHDIMMQVIDKEKGHFFWTPRHRYSFDKSSLKKYVKRMSNDKLSKDDVEKVSDMMMYCSINTFLDSLNFYMLHFSKKLTYVMPLRAIVQRYYRYNNYAVDSIDADGGNLPMFFNGLTDEAFEDFNKRWLLPIFSFELELQPSGGGHVELLVKEKDKPKRNLIDVGFGYTQILPILTIIWKSIMVDCVNTDETDDFCKTHLIAIEQPELHLHPRFQGMLVDMLDRVVKICHEENKDVRIIIETHSEVIINRLGVKVMDERSYINSKDVNVLLFNAKAEGFDTDVVSSTYDNEGYLINWPFGFFSDNVY